MSFRRAQAVAVVAGVAVMSLGMAGKSRGADAPATQPAATGAPDPAAMQKAWAEASKPGPEHAKLAEMAGEWDVEAVDTSSGQPVTSTGSASFRMILGGRYLAHEFRGSMMGQEFSGMGCTGYDNMKKKYVETWIDSGSTGIYVAEGEMNEKGELVTVGTMTAPGMGEVRMRSVAANIDKDTHTFTMYTSIPGMGEMQCMKMTYKRRKA